MPAHRIALGLRDAPVSYESRVVQGVAAGTLMQTAGDLDALMVVVGRRGRSGIAELVLGERATHAHPPVRPTGARGARMTSTGLHASAWYPTPDHPRGEDRTPCFEVLGTFVYPSIGHPSGPSSRPWYQLRGHHAYAVDGHPDGPSSEPSFRLVGDDVHPFPTGPEASAWFRIGPHPG